MHRGSLNIQKEMLRSKVKTFKGVYKGNLEFPEGREFKRKNPSVGDVWILVDTALHYKLGLYLQRTSSSVV